MSKNTFLCGARIMGGGDELPETTEKVSSFQVSWIHTVFASFIFKVAHYIELYPAR